ncbi:DUF1129 domain-containing protein [Enterococcus termitis]|jgi:uncharacterized membrane-anchored protein|uniref:DUF1129 domain-containing protein n=1 Tax=Enterococcus termitis TaxID=332950 RepID=A0A1E5GWB8_9ENTE|nr:DUF1129 domain-containing protein [Enterococcus termitis]OEG16936.1 hypothetical protein BCR25_04885 [Enterococcus termitis]OJG99657.1 hypothetical protein RV18_GL001725 [Enterococcus termitis]
MESEALRDIVSENRELEQKLTKRNEQYIFDLKKSLVAANLSEEAQTLALHEILPQLVEGQKSGKTARQLFGTVSERTESILNKPEELPESTPTLMWLDNTLLLFGVMTLMFSIMMMWSKGKTQPLGLLTLVLASMAGGYVFYLMYKYVYQYDRPGMDKSKRPGWFKTGLILVGSMLLWLAVFAGSAMLPAVINPIFDPVIVIILGGVALVVRHFLKKKYNMRSSLAR